MSCHPEAAVAQLAAGRLCAADQCAWELFCAAWLPLERFVRARLVGRKTPPDLLEDCGQNVFTRVWQFRNSYRGRTEREFWTWLRRICDNERRRILGREIRHRRPVSVGDATDPETPVAAGGPPDQAALT